MQAVIDFFDNREVLMPHITAPTFVIDRRRAERNIQRMAEKARCSGATLRPHFKTHQSIEAGRWFREAGVNKITVSSVAMAEFFAAAGWKDITIAFPVNILEADRINRLAARGRLGLLVDNRESLYQLNRLLKHPAAVWVKVDTGYHRSGVLWTDTVTLQNLVQTIEVSRHMSFGGLLTHAGHSYHLRGRESHIRLYNETAERLRAAREGLPAALRSSCRLSLGDTPTCTAAENFDGVDEVRPGNFVFFDVQQLMLGSCTEEEIAAAAVCPVVGVYPDRKEAVIYGGAVHLSKQAETLSDGTRMYGFAVSWDGECWGAVDPGCYVRDVSQEHGIVRFPGDLPVKPGDLLAVLPVHSCLTANLLKEAVGIIG